MSAEKNKSTDTSSYPLFEKIHDIIKKGNNLIIRQNRNVEKISGKVPELIATLLYVVIHFVISYFHEPWYDEAVAWQIAKCASVKDIIFNLPHYEGHPPLWHLILLPFAKSGCSYELTLSLMSMVFAGAAVMLIIWRSPFPRIIRLLLPFTYFPLYQYGVISRPYCIMMLAFILAAITFTDRDAKPWRHILSLMLLCLTSAYGILFAGGITIVWLIELLKKDGFRFLRNKKITLSLISLLALAILLIIDIFPASDTYATATDPFVRKENNLLMRLVYTFIVMPADAVVTNVYSDYGLLSTINIYNYSIVAGITAGIFIWICAIYFSYKKGTSLTLLIPYSFFAVFSATKYLSPHHIGIAFLFGLFVLWCSCSRSNINKSDKNENPECILHYTARIAAVIFMAVSLYWGVKASIGDIRYSYDNGKDMAQYIEQNNLDDYNILSSFATFYDWDEEGNLTDDIIAYDFNHCCLDNIQAYFDHNIFFNINDGRDDMAYTFHKFSGLEENTERIEKWRAQGPPDVYLAQMYEFDIIYEGIADASDYVLVYSSEFTRMWKGEAPVSFSCIYVRKELAKELGLKRAFG